MLRRLNFQFVRHCDLSEKIRDEIIALKSQHWDYPYPSQIEWMENNLRGDDIHLLGTQASDKGILGYLNLFSIKLYIQGEEKNVVGIGNVCVEKGHRHKGLGTALIDEAGKFIKKRQNGGILLCPDSLVSFYEHSDWRKIVPSKLYVAGREYPDNLMAFNFGEESTQIENDEWIYSDTLYIDRRF